MKSYGEENPMKDLDQTELQAIVCGIKLPFSPWPLGNTFYPVIDHSPWSYDKRF